jgi:hypothetical protein
MAFERGTIYIFLGEIMIDRCNGCNVTTFIMVDTLLNMFNYHENLMVDTTSLSNHVAVCQNLVPLVNIKIAGKWMFIPLKMVLIGIDPYPC